MLNSAVVTDGDACGEVMLFPEDKTRTTKRCTKALKKAIEAEFNVDVDTTDTTSFETGSRIIELIYLDRHVNCPELLNEALGDVYDSILNHNSEAEIRHCFRRRGKHSHSRKLSLEENE